MIICKATIKKESFITDKIMEKFIALFADAIEREESIKMDDVFRDYDEWSSLAYLSVIAMMDEEYDVQLEEKEFKNLITVQDIYNVCVAGGQKE